jgi:sec-independent protein translocase protein TatA
MFKSIGLPELLIVLAVVILLFGVGRISKISKELGSGIRNFKEGLQGEDKGKEAVKELEKEENKKE